jgi:protease-4
MSGEAAVQKRGLVSRLLRKPRLYIAGAAAAAAYYMTREKPEEDENKKKVLVIPFHRLNIVEKQESGFRSRLRKLDRDQGGTLTMELQELVDVIHHAASDPNVVALYGVFGHGGTNLAGTGWADLEEVRNALRVFRESDRRHREPNFSYEKNAIPRVQGKPLYAYADSFHGMMDPSNKDYYLASIFTHLHLQKCGELDLLGMFAQQFFLRDFLDKYGINLHVFKHGAYKNAPNMFTASTFDRAHRENVTNILEDVNEGVCDDITDSRSEALLASWLKDKKQSRGSLWKRIHESGTFPAQTAWQAGLIDYMPRRDPLPDLVESNQSQEKKTQITENWKDQETDFESFKAEASVDLVNYARKVERKKKAKNRKSWSEHADELAGNAMSLVGSTTLLASSSPEKEKVALLHVDGTIGASTARKLVESIRKIRKDDATKCVVVRVSSPGGTIHSCETILQELKAMNRPIVFSFGNYAASGGYYIATGANRIFANKKTVTGSIGVFGVRMDLIDFAARYGINIEQVMVSNLSGTYNPFIPMTRKMKQNIAGTVDRYYAQFKNVVSEGRGLSEEEVEAIAQGRVWTGDQAKTNGLVDEIGGLQRAIAFARRNWCCDEDAEVVVWPKKKSFFSELLALGNDDEMEESAIREWLFPNSGDQLFVHQTGSPPLLLLDWIFRSPRVPGTLSGVLLAMDENAAIHCLLENARDGTREVQQREPVLPSFIWD